MFGQLRRYSTLFSMSVVVGLAACGSSTSQTPPATASSATVSTLTFSPEPFVLRKGESKELHATAVNGDGSKNDVSKDGQWTSDNPKTATVDTKGTVVGVDPGVTKVNLSYRGVSGSVTVTVSP
jgi:uncharacterized protein YjdB